MTTEYEAATEGAAFFELTDHALIEAVGPDARSFLHNLCTQDVKNLPVGAGCEAFLTTNKARVIAHLWISHWQANHLLLDLAHGQAIKVLQHLNQFLISEQVELIDRTREFHVFRVVGPQAAARLQPITGAPWSALPLLHHRHVAGVGMVRRHHLLGLDGYDLFCPVAGVEALRRRLIEADVAAMDKTGPYRTLRIEAGLPEYGIDIDEHRLAMEVNRTAQAISYTKGCYLGQETIVMARDRGQVNRLLMGVTVSQGEPLVPGTKLFRAGEEVGHVTSSVFSPRLGQVIALAYLRRGCWDVGTEVTIDPATDGRMAIVCALPVGC